MTTLSREINNRVEAIKNALNDISKQTNLLDPKIRLKSRCLCLARALLVRKESFLQLSHQKQLMKILHFSFLTSVGIIGVAVGVAVIVSFGGTATPILVGILVPLVLVGAGVFSTDVAMAALDRSKKRFLRMTGLSREIQQTTKLRRREDVIQLSAEICTQFPQIEERKNFF